MNEKEKYKNHLFIIMAFFIRQFFILYSTKLIIPTIIFCTPSYNYTLSNVTFIVNSIVHRPNLYLEVHPRGDGAMDDLRHLMVPYKKDRR